jgi:hypothetical protein
VTTRARVWLGLAVAFGFGLWFVPLFGVLGYELALVAAAFAAICGLDLGAARARRVQGLRGPVLERASFPGPVLARGALTSGALAVAIVCVPAVLAAIHGIWTPTCDWWFGIEAYALMPLTTAALGGVIGHALAVAVGRRADDGPWWKPHRSTWLAVVAPIVVLVVAGFWRFYSEPPVFIYNALIGYFPGNMYDENIHLGMPVVWSRLEQLAAAIAIVAAVASRLDVPRYCIAREPRPQRRRVPPLVIALAFAGIAGVLRMRAGDLGYAIDAAEIQGELSGRVETAHFVIHYAQTPEIEKDIQLIARDHELRYAEVVAEIGVAPEGKITSYYFANPEQKARWFGARNVEMAKPWRHEIYLDHRAFPHTSLRHEIAHVIASAFGDRFFGVATKNVVLFNPGLIEGLAVALDWPGTYDRLTPHEAVRALQAMGMQPTIAELLSIKFFSVASARGYTTAGSFLHFLLERYGAAHLRDLYKSGGDFGGVYGKPEAELEREWREMLSKIELPPEVVEGTRERFRGGSVFSRPCPHAIAARREAALTALGHGDRAHAIDLMRHVCADAPEEPRHRLELGDFLAGGSDTEKSEASSIWTTLAGDKAVTSSLRAQALQRLAVVAPTDAAKITLVDAARGLPIDPAERRQFDAESFALHYTGAAGPALRAYFFRDAPNVDLVQLAAAIVTAEPTLGFAHYLLGLQKTNAGDWAAAAAELDAGLERGLPGTNFVRNGARLLAIAAYRTNDLERLGRAMGTLYGPDMAETDHLLADDWGRRVLFDLTGKL